MTQEYAAVEANTSDPTLSASLPTYSTAQIASYLSHGYWTQSGQSPHAFNTPQIYYNIDGLAAEGKALAQAALNSWANVSGLSFVQTSNQSITQIQFEDDYGQGAYASYVAASGTTKSAVVNVSSDWVAAYGTGTNSYSYQTYIHEIGHALGLGHAGNYNVSSDWDANGAGGNHYLNDSWQATIMSYFSQDENTAVDASFAWVSGPMMADIAAIQNLYGVATQIRTGNTTYGFNSNSLPEHNFGQYAQGDVAAFTIYDNGGIDTLDASGFSVTQKLDLRAGQYSDVGGDVGNIGIYLNTVVENAVGGSGADNIFGNSASNVLFGHSGADTISGGSGNDSIWGNRMNVSGSSDDGDYIYGEGGNDLIYGNQGWDNISGGEGADTIYGGRDNDVLFGNASNPTGTDAADLIYGNQGDDTIFGNQENDTLYGGEDQDTIYGGRGNDTIWGHDPSLVGVTLDLSDAIYGNEGDDLIYGNQGRDTVEGGIGSDTIYGGFDGDYLYGNDLNGDHSVDGNDIIYGNQGDDYIWAQQGNDSLFGDDGNDLVCGGGGNDGMFGGNGADNFMFQPDWGYDAICDFTPGADKIDMSRVGFYYGFSSMSDLSIFNYNGNVVVAYGNSNVQLVGFGGVLQSSDFIF